MSSFVVRTLEVSQRIKNRRDPRDVLMTLVEEVGELSTEIAIASGHKNREPGADGIIGEAVDVIVAALDVIHLMYQEKQYAPETIELLLLDKAQKKLDKWEAGVRKDEDLVR
jgi:NTP pyrophosphatase (non-canonical NTP hydrolase)